MRLDGLFADAPLNVISEISPNDAMFQGNTTHYLEAGHSALRCIRLALSLASRNRVRRILDFPCGYGRVLRVLRAQFPAAELTASDIDRDAVDFCARVFTAQGAYSEPQPDRIALQGPFDLIWVGSLFTHLAPARWGGFLSLFRSLLSANGVLVLSVEGRFAVNELREKRSRLGLPEDAAERIVAGHKRIGFAFEAYSGRVDYGCCLSSPSWVCRQMEGLPQTRLLFFIERGWMERQDVVACLADASYAGFLDRADPSGISGWAWDALRPEIPVGVDILVDGELVETVEASEFRQDLLAAGIGDGTHGFSHRFAAGSRDARGRSVAARFADTAVHLRRSPRTVPR